MFNLFFFQLNQFWKKVDFFTWLYCCSTYTVHTVTHSLKCLVRLRAEQSVELMCVFVQCLSFFPLWLFRRLTEFGRLALALGDTSVICICIRGKLESTQSSLVSVSRSFLNTLIAGMTPWVHFSIRPGKCKTASGHWWWRLQDGVNLWRERNTLTSFSKSATAKSRSTRYLREIV